METTNQKQHLLNFNGKEIIIVKHDGIYWLSIRSLAEALNLNVRRVMQNLKKDTILGPARADLLAQVPKNGKIQGRNITCISEQYVYGWIFSLNSTNEGILEYKREIYDLLYHHFKGTIVRRQELLQQRMEVDRQIAELTIDMKKQDANYQQLQHLKTQRKTISTQLNSADRELVKQPELFEG